MEKKTSNFSGQIGFVLAAAGSAVGVGKDVILSVRLEYPTMRGL